MDDNFILQMDLPFGAVGYVVVDSTLRDTASGGVRMCPDLDLQEVRVLAREMTLKFCFAGLGRGGAKSGIRIPHDMAEGGKLAVCEEFGRRLGPIIRKGIYYPGMDMNCGPEELRAIYRGAGIVVGAFTDTSFFTAVSVGASLEACRRLRAPGRPMTVAIEGFGSVGAHLARRLPREDFRVVAVSTVEGAVADWGGFDPESLVEARKRHGDAFISRIPGEYLEPEDLLAVEVDILVPAARVRSITADNAGSVRARAIVPAANAPYSAEAVDMLHDRGVLALPGFVTNAGGVFGSGLHDSGVSAECVEDLVTTGFLPAVVDLVEAGQRTGEPVARVAESVAAERRKRLQGRDASPGRAERVFRRFDRSGLCPGFMRKHLAVRRFERGMGELRDLIRERKE